LKLVNKYLAVRRDGTVLECPYLVIGARDPAAPAALRALADEYEALGMDAELVDDLHGQANDWERFRVEFGDGDPDAPLHRTDDPSVVARFQETYGSARTYPNGELHPMGADFVIRTEDTE
jgi:hypothetical protein